MKKKPKIENPPNPLLSFKKYAHKTPQSHWP